LESSSRFSKAEGDGDRVPCCPWCEEPINGVIVSGALVLQVIGLEVSCEGFFESVNSEYAFSVLILAAKPFVLGCIVL